MLRNNEYGNF